MAKHKVTVQQASEAELGSLASWYRMADPEMPHEPDQVLNDRHVSASRSGVLGSSLGHSDDQALMKCLEYDDLLDQFMARTLVLSARVDGQTVGMLVMGPPSALYVKMMKRIPPTEQELIQRVHLGIVFGLSKLDVVCVAPENRGRGLGARLVRHTIGIARESAVMQIYGQFREEDALKPFYEKLGFEVCSPGETLRVRAGAPIEIFSKPTEALFSKRIGLPDSAVSRAY